MKNLFARFIKEEEGQDLIEYALLAALIAVVPRVVIMPRSGRSSDVIFSELNAEWARLCPCPALRHRRTASPGPSLPAEFGRAEHGASSSRSSAARGEAL